MKHYTHYLLLLLLILPLKGHAQIYSFENDSQLKGWSIDKGAIQLTDTKQKLGRKSLKINWQPQAVLTIDAPAGLNEATRATNGGINAWIYNERPIDASLTFCFLDATGKELCRQDFSLDFKGWRCLWAKFVEDMGKMPHARISKVEVRLPRAKEGGNLYFDYVEFTRNVSWQKMSDAQYRVNQKDYSLIPNFTEYRNTSAYVPQIVKSNDAQLAVIEKRLTEWYLGSDSQPSHDWVSLRKTKEEEYIRKGVAEGNYIRPAYDAAHTPIGEGLFPMYAPSVIDGEKVRNFRGINEKIFIPLALDYRKNGNKSSLQKALYLYDWFSDQGWADGSGLGTLCFEKLRSSGYFHSFFLLKEELTSEQRERELKALKWFTLFGNCYQAPASTGEVADNLRALALPKLIYALSITDKQQREVAMTAFRNYMDNALSFAPGFFGTIKPDFSGYHHRGPYNSAYYPHALYAASLVAYLLHDTPYALSENTMKNLKQSLLTFRFFCAGLDVPAGTVGRFPLKRQVLETLLPAYAYVALAQKKPDTELASAFKRIATNPTYQQPISDYLADVNSTLTYTSSVGEAELMTRLLNTPVKAEAEPMGSLFMPYSGLMVVKNAEYHFNMKGFSRYIWDFESSATENLKGRYLAYGQVEYFDRKTGNRSFTPEQNGFDWNYIPGTTVRVLPDSLLQDKGGSKSGHRNFSDETFLTGVHASAQTALFSFRLHDITYDATHRANKSVFVMDDVMLCLGSDITNKDQLHPTVTTLFQCVTPRKQTKEEKTRNGYLINDASLLYAVKEGNLATRYQNGWATAYIDHSNAPASGKYHYYMLPANDRKQAKRLLATDSPVKVLAQDNDAHIVAHIGKKAVYAALFNAQKVYDDLLVKQVNIPLSYILEQKGEQHFRLTLCEPDMRRTSREHMGLLTDEDVIQQEKPFNTTLTLTGIYEATSPQQEIVVLVNKEKCETTITLSTIRGENYMVELRAL